ncbi:MAG: zinc ribbon domain-containing protein [Clostridia bacterium]|nr:zinc ribbon domain-containing protein [Clostridia bacterium]
MICKNCGTECQDNVTHCVNCGAYLQQDNQYQQNTQYQQNEPYTMPNYGNYNVYNQPVQENKPVSMGTYLGWLLLGTVLGPISIVISIVFACMTENRNRANFFRAMLVIWAISVVIAIIAIAVLAVIGFTALEYVDPSIMDSYDSFYYDEFLKIASLIRF